MAKKKNKVELKKLSKRQYDKAVERLGKEDKATLMSDYEQDLTWMAYRYAIGRQTIHAVSMAKEMAAHIPNRLTKERQMFMAHDIQKEIAHVLRFASYFFDIGISVERNSKDFVPLDLFYRFMQEYNIVDKNDLLKYKRIYCERNEVSGKIEFTPVLVENDEQKATYVSTVFDDLEVWSDLAKLLDTSYHKWCLAKKDGKSYLVEYFEKMEREMSAYNVYHTIKIPCNAFSENAYVVPYIEEGTIVEDNILDDRVYELSNAKDIEVLCL